MIDWLFEHLGRNRSAGAVGTPGRTHTYGELLDTIQARIEDLARIDVTPGTVASLEGDYGADSIACFLALAARGAIVVPISSDAARSRDDFLEISEVELRVSPSTGEANVTPSSCTLRNGPRLKTWKPPESVRIGRGQAMNRCRPPCAATTSTPGRNQR